MSEPSKEVDPDAFTYGTLFVVPMLSGFLLQFLVAPDAAAPGWFDTLGIIVGGILPLAYGASKWLRSDRVIRHPR